MIRASTTLGALANVTVLVRLDRLIVVAVLASHPNDMEVRVLARSHPKSREPSQGPVSIDALDCAMNRLKAI